MGTYRKKGMEPIITKFQIDPEKNTEFNKIVDLFENQPNYQEWAVKIYFSKAASLNVINAVKDFIDRFSAQIKDLELGNIVSYKTKAQVTKLLQEMNGIATISYLKTQFEKFNTEQKKMLIGRYFKDEITPEQAAKSSELKGLVNVFKSLELLPSVRRKTFWSNCSLIKNPEGIIQAVADCAKGDYIWDKDDLLYFLANTNETKDCKIIVDNGPVVVIKVPTYAASRILGGGGRTQWCICTEERYFRNYVLDKGNDQYFLFDFSKNERQELAHVAFTIQKGVGICNAFSCTDKDILSGTIESKGVKYNIFKALAEANVKMGSFISVQNTSFSWNAEEFIKFVKKNTSKFALCYAKDNVVVLNVLTRDGLTMLLKHTFIKTDRLLIGENSKVYILFNFNVEESDEHSMCAVSYAVDIYGTYSSGDAYSIFGTTENIDEYTKAIGISKSDYLDKEDIEPNVLLHKYIDTKQEDKAVELLENEDVDVNFIFNERPPVFSAISNSMFKVYDKIVSNPNFNMNVQDGFGESLVEALVFQLDMCENDQAEHDFIVNCIIKAIESPAFMPNVTDLNDDTLLNICCEDEDKNWVIERIISNPKLDVNLKNFFGLTPLMSAINSGNKHAIKLLSTRPDLTVSKEEVTLMKNEGLDPSEFFSESKALAN